MGFYNGPVQSRRSTMQRFCGDHTEMKSPKPRIETADMALRAASVWRLRGDKQWFVTLVYSTEGVQLLVFDRDGTSIV